MRNGYNRSFHGKKAKRIIGAEIVPEAVLDAKRNALENGIENAEFICADAGEAAQELSSRGIKPDVVLLDPPRKGCSEMLLAEIVKMSPERIVYVSCDPSTLARDCFRLKDLGYETKRLAAADLFPRTVHVESVALLTKQNKVYLFLRAVLDKCAILMMRIRFLCPKSYLN